MKTNQPAAETSKTAQDGLFFNGESKPGSFFGAVVQPKLTVNTPGDEYEREADSVADQVMRMHEGESPVVQRMPLTPLNGVQRMCSKCAEKEEEQQEVHRKESGGSDASGKAAPSIVSDVLSSGGGQAMDGGTRQFMESRFGQDFSSVRIHTGSRAAESAGAIQARAYTSGKDVVFGSGEYQPASDSGRRLLAHELVHVGQQGGVLGTLQRKTTKEPEIPENDIQVIIDQIHSAAQGWGTDEEAIYRALQHLNRGSVNIERANTAYKAKYGKSIEWVLRDEMSGKELAFALELIGIHQKGENLIPELPTTDEEYEKVAARLYKAMKGWGTDEEEIFAVLLPFQGNAAAFSTLKETYKKKFNQNLEEEIADELSGSEKQYADALQGKYRYIDEEARYVLSFIKTEAAKLATQPRSIDPDSAFYKRLKDHYLKDYLAKPSKEAGKKAVERIGEPIKGRGDRSTRGYYEVEPTAGVVRPAEDRWEAGAYFWNNTEVPKLPKEFQDLPIFENMKKLPAKLEAATAILLTENESILPILDVSFLIGDPNPGKHDINIDIVGGGKNVSSLMHWATGVKHAKEDAKALRELFLAYEIWHLEGWDVFGQDPINDLISEEQGRQLGVELLKGESGALTNEASLLPFLNRSFQGARAWVGAVLRLRKAALEKWILSKEPIAAIEHWDEDKKFQPWDSLTIHQMLSSGKTMDEVQKSPIVEKQIEIYSLLYEADNWEKTNGPVGLTDLQERLAKGQLDKILSIFALMEEKKGYKASGDLGRFKAASNEKKALQPKSR